MASVLVWLSMSALSDRSMSSARAATFAVMLTAPFGPTTSFTKNASSDIIGPHPASYHPTEPSSNVTCRCP